MMTKVLSKKLRADARIDKHSITAIMDLIKRDGRVVGAWGVDYQNGALVDLHARSRPFSAPAAAAACSTSTTTRRR